MKRWLMYFCESTEFTKTRCLLLLIRRVDLMPFILDFFEALSISSVKNGIRYKWLVPK